MAPSGSTSGKTNLPSAVGKVPEDQTDGQRARYRSRSPLKTLTEESSSSESSVESDLPDKKQERKEEKDELQSAQEQRDVVNLSSESSTDSGADEISPTY